MVTIDIMKTAAHVHVKLVARETRSHGYSHTTDYHTGVNTLYPYNLLSHQTWMHTHLVYITDVDIILYPYSLLSHRREYIHITVYHTDVDIYYTVYIIQTWTYTIQYISHTHINTPLAKSHDQSCDNHMTYPGCILGS